MILLLGGTKDSVLLAAELKKQGMTLVLSTATEYGAALASQGYDGAVIHGRMNQNEMLAFYQTYKITHVVDATHPFARIVSETAIAASRLLGIPYLRYERPKSDSLKSSNREALHCFDTFEQACHWLNTTQGNILITTGSKDAASIYAQIQGKERLFFRFLPLSSQMLKMEQLGLKANQLIAMQGPFSLEMNIAMILQLKASILVTKESGKQGFVDEKIAAAKACGIAVAVILRPNVAYPLLFTEMEPLLQYMRNTWII